MPSPRSAFTLVELLVTIGVIGVLVALLIPALSRAQGQAKQLRCATQLRQIGVGVQIYVTDNRGFLVPTSRATQMFNGRDVFPDRDGTGWAEHIAATLKLKQPKLFRCDLYPDNCEFTYFMTARYLASQNLATMRASEIKTGGRFVMAAECTRGASFRPPFGVLDWPFDDCDRDDAGDPSLRFKYDDGGISVHPGGNNVLFDDGHVAAFQRWEPQTMTMHPKRLTDWDGASD
jgi:prepilin-type N-terminal cleavage/methylation domain-containing protein/prepilin-type processing-associated H-X9-DG protein